ncbi:MAG: hemerythrin domain-containing protein [Gemmatimonadota bacterium]
MSRQTPTDLLRRQHQNILRVASVLERILEDEPVTGSLDFDGVADCIDFIRLYADALHHGKEEDLLFPALEEVGMPRDSGPVAVMLHEHRQGRQYAAAMADALPAAREGDREAHDRLVNAAFGYIRLIRQHILKEDNILFNWADQMIPEPACRSLCAAYEGVCARHFDGRSVAELEAILERLLERDPGA